jgi:MYXO-CTERM domain-containing protein
MNKPARHVLALAITLAVGAFSVPAFAHDGCEADGDCADGEVCHEGECSATCEADTDCPDDQSCGEGVCLHAEEEGCTAGGTPPGESLPLVALALLAVPFARRRAQRAYG